MAGIVVPTMFLLVGVTGFTIAREVYDLPIALDRIIIFPMAVVPNLWGLWNILHLAVGRERWSIGAHGALLPLILIPSGLALAALFRIEAITPAVVLSFAPFAIAVYYLAWKYLVGFFNGVLGIA